MCAKKGTKPTVASPKLNRPQGRVGPHKVSTNPKHPSVGNRQFRRFYRHYRTGKLMDAYEYGYWGWPIGGG